VSRSFFWQVVCGEVVRRLVGRLLTPVILTPVRKPDACEQSVHARMSRTTSPGAMASGRPPVS
jgi:hypothetical protein